jgi:hypothetical protein
METEKNSNPQLQPMPKTLKMVTEQAQMRLSRALPPAWKITKDLNLATARMSTKFDGTLTIQNAKFEKMNFLVAVKT